MKLIKKKSFEAAIKSLKKAEINSKNDPDIYNYLGYSNRKLGNMEKAASRIRAAAPAARASAASSCATVMPWCLGVGAGDGTGVGAKVGAGVGGPVVHVTRTEALREPRTGLSVSPLGSTAWDFASSTASPNSGAMAQPRCASSYCR